MDEAGNGSIQTSDPAGRVSAVCEIIRGNDAQGNAPTPCKGPGAKTGFTTTYGYDPLDNLTSVIEGAQVRTFAYDGLSRLWSANNPESDLVTYTYTTPQGSLCSGDPSNVCTRTDARGIITAYSYADPLNRLTAKAYSGTAPSGAYTATPSVSYMYDTLPVTPLAVERRPILRSTRSGG